MSGVVWRRRLPIALIAVVLASSACRADETGSAPDGPPPTVEPLSVAAVAAEEESAPPTTADPAVRAAAVERCGALEGELIRREEGDLIDWAAFDDEGEELSEDQVDRMTFELPSYDGSVAAPVERPSFEGFAEEVALGELPALDIALGVDSCYETGILADIDLDGDDDELDEDEPDEDEPDEDEPDEDEPDEDDDEEE
ncbi:MAG: hypothetical protein AAGA99_09970 [Actinomycetota bacterium]